MAFTPSTRVYLCGVPFDSLNKNPILFASEALQQAYFTSLILHTYTDFTYQRRDNVIRVGVNIDDLELVNYVFYQNANFGTKYFYAFVTKLVYVSDTRTDLYIETDVFQTWYLSTTFKPSFVEREHVTTDTVGLHTIDEGLEYGEYTYNGAGTTAGLDDTCIIVSMNCENASPWNKIVGTLQDGIYHATAFYYYGGDTAGALALSTMLNALDTAGKSASVVAIYMYPDVLVNYGQADGTRIPVNMSSYLQTVTINKKQSGAFTDTPNGGTAVSYTPKNKKLYCYPYNLLTVVNRAGGVMKYRYEWFYASGATSCVFKVKGNSSASAVVYSVPVNYKYGGGDGNGYNWEEALIIGGFPLVDWNSDVFKNWLSQNAVNIGVGVAGSLLAVGVGISTVNPIAIASGVLGVAGAIGQAYEKSVLPAGVNGHSNSADTKTSLGIMDFGYYPMRITAEYMKRLDQFFEMFGYKITEVKTPNITGRPYWNYVKTIDANITGNIPSDDMVKLKKMFDDGVTIWHTTTGYLNYALDNH